MAWLVEFADEFDEEVAALEKAVRRELLASLRALQQRGPRLGRPRVDTLKGSKHVNMKELRFDAAGGVWRAAFAFDPDRTAIILTAQNKAGIAETRFYKRLIRTADARFDRHLQRRAERHGSNT